MRYLWIIVFATLVSSCTGNANHRQFVATPLSDEIVTVVYLTQNSAGRKTWQLTNDDLRVRLTVYSTNGKLLSSQVKKVTPNALNWVVYNLEKANFTKAKSLQNRTPTQTNEVLTITTQSDTYTYAQNSSTRFPNGFQKAINVIPRLLNPK